VIGAAVAGGIGWLTTGLTGLAGSVIAAALSIISALAGIALVLILRRYASVLATGGSKPHSLERQEYNALRKSLAEGNLAVRLYTDWLAKTLNAVDRFFGDAEHADRTLFPHAFGLQTTAPLWTAAAFDRCLLLALLYPIATIFAVWTISNHFGPAEAALGLRGDVPAWGRGLIILAIIFQTFAGFKMSRSKGWHKSVWGIFAFTFAFTFSFAGAAVGAVAIAFAAGGTVAIAAASALGIGIPGAAASAFAVGAGILFFVPPGDGVVSFVGVGAGVGVSAVAIIFVCAWLSHKSARGGWHGLFLFIHGAFFAAACLLAAYAASPLRTWVTLGPELLFLGLLALLNAPFDWLSLGLTRALLRRGLERQGWWPYLYSFVDAALAGIIIAALAIAMVIGVQAFDELAVLGSGKASSAVLPLDKLFNGLAAHPSEPEYWWLYALLLSTMIPSLVNLAIGGASLMRGVPRVPALLLKFMPATRAPTAANRAWIATVLTGQVFVGAILGLAAQVFLFWGIMLYALPKAGLSLLDMARGVADFDLPAKIGHLAAAFL
jgi:hypothetical protein